MIEQRQTAGNDPYSRTKYATKGGDFVKLDGDAKHWIDEAIQKARDAKMADVALLIKHDNGNVVICSSDNAATIEALNKAATREHKGYY